MPFSINPNSTDSVTLIRTMQQIKEANGKMKESLNRLSSGIRIKEPEITKNYSKNKTEGHNQ